MADKPTVYIETTVVSYLTAWPSRDVVRLAHQHQTRDWWHTRRTAFEVLCSELVLQEASAGDAVAASERLAALSALPVLAIGAGATALAKRLIAELRLPTRAQADA